MASGKLAPPAPTKLLPCRKESLGFMAQGLVVSGQGLGFRVLDLGFRLCSAMKIWWVNTPCAGIMLMEKFLHHLGTPNYHGSLVVKECSWCQISSINSMNLGLAWISELGKHGAIS